jgi:SAM-dependent methyltransferase
MRREDIVQLYDDEYAASYDERFLLSPLAKSDTEHELQLLRGFLKPGVAWLDVACGTGYFLRHFPHVKRAGLDLSPAMLRLARESNPDASLIEHDFRDPFLQWRDCWGLVSCMWYAYALVDTIRDTLRLIENLASWTAPEGTCFVPLAQPSMIAGVNLPRQALSAWAGKVMIDGIVWSYVEDDGRKVHSHLITPGIEFMVEQFQAYFEKVSIIQYPPAFEGWECRSALVATRKLIAGFSDGNGTK